MVEEKNMEVQDEFTKGAGSRPNN